MAITLQKPDQQTINPLLPGISPYGGPMVNQTQPQAPQAPLTSPQVPGGVASPSTGITPYTGAPVNSVSAPPTAGPSAAPTTIPPPPPAAAPPAPAGTFTAGSNLIGSQINPAAPTAQAPNTNFGTGAVAPTATAPNTNWGTGAITAGADPQSSAQFGKYTQGFDSALNNLSTGPNRTQLAMQQLQDYETAGQPALAQQFRDVGQQAAKFGRLGAGMTTNDLTGVLGTYQRNKMLMQNDLARSVAEGDINDRYRTADVYGQARGQQYGFGQDQRNYQTGVDQYNQGANFDRMQAANQAQGQYQDRAFGQGQYNQGALFDRQRAANDYSGDYQDRAFSQNRANANDLRGERGYQYGLSQDAQNSAIQQKMMEDQLLNSSQGRALNQYNAGYQGDPTGLYQNFANSQDAVASGLYGNAGQLFGNVGQSQQQQQPDYYAMLMQYLNSQQQPQQGG